MPQTRRTGELEQEGCFSGPACPIVAKSGEIEFSTSYREREGRHGANRRGRTRIYLLPPGGNITTSVGVGSSALEIFSTGVLERFYFRHSLARTLDRLLPPEVHGDGDLGDLLAW